MPRRKKDGPIISKISTRTRKSDGKKIYETTIPIPVGEGKGVWIVQISKDNIITWNTMRNYLDNLNEKKNKTEEAN